MNAAGASGWRSSRALWLCLPGALAVLAVAGPWLGLGPYWTREVMLITMLALMVSGLNLSFGYAGELAFSQVFFYAVGAYLGGYLALNVSTDLLLSLLLAGVAAILVGIIAGGPGLRLGGWPFAMTSFFLVLLIPDLVDIFSTQTGGQIGLVAIPPYTIFGTALSTNGYYEATIVVGIIWFAVFRNLVVSRHGSALLVLRESPILASSLGISVRRMKLTAYAIGAVPAGLAGVLFANLDHFVYPGDFTFSLAIAVLAASVLGGSTSVYGALFGAALLEIGPLRLGVFQQYADAAYGAFLILFGVVLSVGVAGVLKSVGARWRQRRVPRAAARSADRGSIVGTLPGKKLVIRDVEKRFGGLNALVGVSLEALPGRITSIIGPNGSGKTTLLNLISGFYSIDAGEITAGDDKAGGKPPHVIARLGVARTFQMPIVPRNLTVAEAVAAGRYRHSYNPMWASVLRLPSFWRVRKGDRSEVLGALRVVGITHLADERAAAQPLGIRRLIEVARVIVAEPSVILFDEIAAGLDEDELENLARVIRELTGAGATVLLVEHNFRLVLELSDQIYVLAGGALVTSGAPDEIASHPAVLREYLGITEEALAPELSASAERGSG